jgi:hypothetical protein
MPLHDVKCSCGFQGEVFTRVRESIADLVCEGCGTKSLEKTYSPSSKPRRAREWDDRTGKSHEFRCHPSLVKDYRKRLGAFDRSAANMLRDNGGVVFHSRSEARQFRKAVEACQRQDEADRA